MTATVVPLKLNFYDISKLTKSARESDIPGLAGVLFSFDDYLKAKIVGTFLDERFGNCTPLFHFENENYSLVCRSMDMKTFHTMQQEAERERKLMADSLHLSLDTMTVDLPDGKKH